MNGVVMLADGDLDFLYYWTRPGSPTGELALVFGLVLVVAFLAFAWAAFWRKPRKRRHSYPHNQPAAAGGARVERRRRRRRLNFFRVLRRHQSRQRRRRRRDRQANPTLADIGGLPPARQEPPAVS